MDYNLGAIRMRFSRGSRRGARTPAGNPILRPSRRHPGFHPEGDGAIRFYGIQLIVLLAELGHRRAIRSASSGADPKEPDAWRASFAGPNLPPCDIRPESRSSKASFRVEAESEASGIVPIVVQDDPFDAAVPRADGLDRRVGLLTRLCRDLFVGDESPCGWYGAALDLWAEVEEMNDFSLTASGNETARDAPTLP